MFTVTTAFCDWSSTLNYTKTFQAHSVLKVCSCPGLVFFSCLKLNVWTLWRLHNQKAEAIKPQQRSSWVLQQNSGPSDRMCGPHSTRFKSKISVSTLTVVSFECVKWMNSLQSDTKHGSIQAPSRCFRGLLNSKKRTLHL